MRNKFDCSAVLEAVGRNERLPANSTSCCPTTFSSLFEARWRCGAVPDEDSVVPQPGHVFMSDEVSLDIFGRGPTEKTAPCKSKRRKTIDMNFQIMQGRVLDQLSSVLNCTKNEICRIYEKKMI
jgi:hypothetical protein